MIERTTRSLTQEERATLAVVARGYGSLGGLAVTLLLKMLWIAGCTVAGGILILTGASVFLAVKGHSVSPHHLGDGLEFLGIGVGILLLGFGLTILLKTANSQNSQWIAWRSRRRSALQALADEITTVTTYRFRRAARIESSGRDPMASDLAFLELEGGGTLSVTWPDCFLSGDLTMGMEYTQAGPFEMAVLPIGAPLPCAIAFSECDCHQGVLDDLLRMRPDSSMPPGWRIHDEPFDALIARLRRPL